MSLGFQTEVGQIKQLLLKHAMDAFVSDETIGRQWQQLRYRTGRHCRSAGYSEFQLRESKLEVQRRRLTGPQKLAGR